MQSNESKRTRSEAGAASPSSASKRQRGLQHQDVTASGEKQDELLPPISSVSDSLSVPLSIIFREVPQASAAAVAPESAASSHHQQQRRNKPLLSRAEAQAFLTVTLLAQEVDSLVALSAAALKQQYKYESFTKQLQNSNNNEDNPYLRPLLPILHVMSQQIPGTALRHVQTQLERIVAELQTTCVSLRQFSEQNWTLSESLQDAGSGFVLAEEKKRLSDVQDETCTRIDALLETTTTTTTSNTTTTAIGKDAGSSSTTDRVGSVGYQSMKEYCEKIFQSKDSAVQNDTSTRIDASVQTNANAMTTVDKDGDTGGSSSTNHVGLGGNESMKEYREKILQCKDAADKQIPVAGLGGEGTPNSANQQQSDDGQDVGSPMSIDSPEPSVQQSASKRLSLSMNNTPQVQQQVSSTSCHQQNFLSSATSHLSKSPPAQQSSLSVLDSSQPQQPSSSTAAAAALTTTTTTTTTPGASPSMQPQPHSTGNDTKPPHSEENHLSSLSAPEFSSTPAQQQASLSVPDSLAAQQTSLSMVDDSASQQQRQQQQLLSSTTTSKQAPSQEKENVSSQEHQGVAYDLIYGESQAGSSQGSFAESQNCRLGSATQSAAEVLSALASTTKTRMASSPK